MGAAVVLSAGRLAYAQRATTAASMEGRAANEYRNNLKNNYRLGLAKDYKKPTYESMYTRYGSDTAVARAAGRTNAQLNGIAAQGLTGALWLRGNAGNDWGASFY